MGEGSNRRRAMWAGVLASLLTLLSAGAGQAPATIGSASSTYFEFGIVVALGQRSVDIQTFDPKKQKLVQHSFVLGRDAHADVVHVGDTVEVIFTPGVDWTVRRLVQLSGAVPIAGQPTEGGREVPAATNTRLPQTSVGGKVPAASTAAVAATKNRGVAPPASVGKSQPAASAVDLGNTSKEKKPEVVSASLGGSALVAKPRLATPKEVAHEMPAEECNRSSADWPLQPLRMAVLDFRYPTEREESHDIGTTGGGSGTAVADLVFARLDQRNEFAMSRGDRTRLYRSDFAGAARAGRELGVDAVLAGTFAPVDPPPGSDPDFPPAKTYELRAGIVDTCTGQLLMRLTSVTCADGVDPNASVASPSCKRFAVTAKQASDPRQMAQAFQGPLDAMLFPLEHNGPPPGTAGSAGVVTGALNGTVTLKLAAGTVLKTGDQVAIHAWRLTKNPTTYTLHNLHDEEIGRVTITGVDGAVATGTFAGDFPPRSGDTAEKVTE